MDSSGDAYIAGSNSSGAFVTELNAAGTAASYTTYLGNGGSSQSIAVDSSGDAYVTGWTDSTTFPTLNPLQAQKTGGNDGNGLPNSDVFVTTLNAASSGLLFSTYLGGSGDDYGRRSDDGHRPGLHRTGPDLAARSGAVTGCHHKKPRLPSTMRGVTASSSHRAHRIV